jgi:hypothetical protein
MRARFSLQPRIAYFHQILAQIGRQIGYRTRPVRAAFRLARTFFTVNGPWNNCLNQAISPQITPQGLFRRFSRRLEGAMAISGGWWVEGFRETAIKLFKGAVARDGPEEICPPFGKRLQDADH